MKRYAIILGIFILFYIALVFLIPPDPVTLKRFNLTVPQVRFLSLTVVLLLAGIWYSALYGYSKFKEYALKIAHSPDGHAFNTLANGVGLLALGLPVSSLASTVLRYIAQINPNLTPTTVVIGRYITLGFAIAAMILIYRGSKNLVALTSKKFKDSRYLWIGILAVLIMGGLYGYVALANTASNIPDPVSGRAIYYLPVWLIVTTNIIPYILSWLLGLRAIGFVLFFGNNTRGLVYKRALGYFATGLSLIVSSSIATQLFTALGNTPRDWGLQSLLVFVYFLLATMAVGYILIAIGAKKLKKIEEV